MSAARGDAQVEYALVLGSNLRPARHLRFGLQRILDGREVLACAGPLRTRDTGGGRFLNAALRVRTREDAGTLRAALHAIEDAAGRVRGSGRVSLDIDIVASRAAEGQVQVHKPRDVEHGYVRELLARIGFA